MTSKCLILMKTPTNRKGCPSQEALQGFTWIELLVVVMCLATLAATLVPAFATGSVKSAALTCLNNKRQLILAWQKYAEDHNGTLVHSFHGGDAHRGQAANNPRNEPWALGWMDWTSASDNTNSLFLTDDRYSKLAKYLGNNPRVYKCPSDIYVSSVQKIDGWWSRVRSVSMNVGIGDGNAESGPWDGLMYKHIRRISEFTFPGPMETWVFMDEHPDSINDPGFFNPRATSWSDQPGTYHNAAATVAFADGHSEIHKWIGSLNVAPAIRVKFNNTISAVFTAGDPDLQWVSYHGGRRTAQSY